MIIFFNFPFPSSACLNVNPTPHPFSHLLKPPCHDDPNLLNSKNIYFALWEKLSRTQAKGILYGHFVTQIVAKNPCLDIFTVMW